MTYLARITECKHGLKSRCWVAYCPGGTTTRIEPDYEAAARKLWTERLGEPQDFASEMAQHSLVSITLEQVAAVVDAALGGSEI